MVGRSCRQTAPIGLASARASSQIVASDDTAPGTQSQHFSFVERQTERQSQHFGFVERQTARRTGSTGKPAATRPEGHVDPWKTGPSAGTERFRRQSQASTAHTKSMCLLDDASSLTGGRQQTGTRSQHDPQESKDEHGSRAGISGDESDFS